MVLAIAAAVAAAAAGHDMTTVPVSQRGGIIAGDDSGKSSLPTLCLVLASAGTVSSLLQRLMLEFRPSFPCASHGCIVDAGQRARRAQ